MVQRFKSKDGKLVGLSRSGNLYWSNWEGTPKCVSSQRETRKQKAKSALEKKESRLVTSKRLVLQNQPMSQLINQKRK